MKLLVKFILSMEKLFKNPIEWFAKQPWFLRMLLTLLLIPLISTTSILSYQKLAFGSDGQTGEISAGSTQLLKAEMNKLHDAQLKEILLLREDVAMLKKLLQPSSLVDAASEGAELVLGTQDESAVSENLRQRIEKLATTNGDDTTKLAYVIDGQGEVNVYAQPTTTSKKITTLQPDTFYVALTENEDWLQIDLTADQSGWIEKKLVMTLPIHENN